MRFGLVVCLSVYLFIHTFLAFGEGQLSVDSNGAIGSVLSQQNPFLNRVPGTYYFAKSFDFMGTPYRGLDGIALIPARPGQSRAANVGAFRVSREFGNRLHYANNVEVFPALGRESLFISGLDPITGKRNDQLLINSDGALIDVSNRLPQDPSVVAATYRASIGDLNGDGVPDIIRHNANSRIMELLIYDFSTDQYTDQKLTLLPPVQNTLGEYPSRSFIADVNNDGLNDIIFSTPVPPTGGSTVGEETSILYQLSVGVFVWVGLQQGISCAATQVADFDNNGFVDVFCGLGVDTGFWINDGNLTFRHVPLSTFQSPLSNQTTIVTPFQSQVVDINQDGFLDMVLSTYLPQQRGNRTFVFLHDPNSPFDFELALVPLGPHAQANNGRFMHFVLTDVNMDLKTDIVTLVPESSGTTAFDIFLGSY